MKADRSDMIRCAGPADDANRQAPYLPMRERVGTPAA